MIFHIISLIINDLKSYCLIIIQKEEKPHKREAKYYTAVSTQRRNDAMKLPYNANAYYSLLFAGGVVAVSLDRQDFFLFV